MRGLYVAFDGRSWQEAFSPHYDAARAWFLRRCLWDRNPDDAADECIGFCLNEFMRQWGRGENVKLRYHYILARVRGGRRWIVYGHGGNGTPKSVNAAPFGEGAAARIVARASSPEDRERIDRALKLFPPWVTVAVGALLEGHTLRDAGRLAGRSRFPVRVHVRRLLRGLGF